MRVKTLEIVWHEQQPVYSVDIQPYSLNGAGTSYDHPDTSPSAPCIGRSAADGWRLATGGADGQVRLWHVYTPSTGLYFEDGRNELRTKSASSSKQSEEPAVEYLATLQKHNQAVNVVRFSPNGEILASAGDDGNILFWISSVGRGKQFGLAQDDLKYEKENWRVRQSTRNLAEIYDIAWSPCGNFILTGSTDNCARIFDTRDGGLVHQIADHSHYIQGVAWDPLGEYIATQSSDRSVHVYSITIRDSQISTQQIGKNTKIEAPRFVRSLTPSPSPSRHVRERSHERNQSMGQQQHIMPAPEPNYAPLTIGILNAQHSIGPLPTPSGSLPSTPASSTIALPIARSLSRRSSYSASNAASPPPRDMRSPSPAPSMHPPLQAIRPASPRSATSKSTSWKMYHDESLVSFFRRLNFSPEGSLLLTPAGRHKPADGRADKEGSESLSEEGTTSSNQLLGASSSNQDLRNTVYIYTRTGLSKSPVAHLPGHRLPSVATRVSPVLYKLRKKVGSRTEGEPEHVTLEKGTTKVANLSLDENEERDSEPMHPPHSVFALPYRMIFAIATQDAVLIYDTQQKTPLAMFTNFHYATFTDLTWSPDGATLILSSSDGYCTIVAFDPNELGQAHTMQPSTASTVNHTIGAVESPRLPQAIGPSMPSTLNLRAPTPPPTPALSTLPSEALTSSTSFEAPMPARMDLNPANEPEINAKSSEKRPAGDAAASKAPDGSSTSLLDTETSKKKRRVQLTFEGGLQSKH